MCPSLSVHARCERRQRAERGPTLVVGDPTRSLSHVPAEIQAVSAARYGTTFEHARTLAELVSGAMQADVVHIASHGRYDATNPYRSGLCLAPDDTPPGVFGDYWSGSTTTADRVEERYRIGTVAEIMANIKLPRCRLAVLSACESGISAVHGSGEMIGLPAAFLAAGARSVIASMWRVDDAATAVMMSHFYSRWVGGSGKEPGPARALIQARADLRATTATEAITILGADPGWFSERPFDDPHYCDAFTCYGAA